MSKIQPIPEGYHSLTPYLILNEASLAIEFYKKAFGAKELFCMKKPDGTVAHAEMQFGDSKLMLADECPEMKGFSPKSIGGSPIFIHFYVEDVDAVVEAAVLQGATILRPLANQFYGDRSCTVADPFGYTWTISTHIEDVSPEEIGKRAKEWMENSQK